MRSVTLSAGAGSLGREIPAVLVETREPDAPGLVLIHARSGIDGHIRDMADRFAAAGLAVVAPDLFHGRTAVEGVEDTRLKELDLATALEDIAGAASFLRDLDGRRRRVGVLGFCVGGALALEAAATSQGLDAVVSFYGLLERTRAKGTQITAPVQAHFARNDEWAKPDGAAAIQEQLLAVGRTMELHLYDAHHGFMNDTLADVYDAQAAAVAWPRAIAFLRSALAG